MIQDDRELQITRQRIDQFIDLLNQLRQTTRPEERAAVMSGYRLEVEQMQREVLDFLTRQPKTTAKAG